MQQRLIEYFPLSAIYIAGLIKLHTSRTNDLNFQRAETWLQKNFLPINKYLYLTKENVKTHGCSFIIIPPSKWEIGSRFARARARAATYATLTRMYERDVNVIQIPSANIIPRRSRPEGDDKNSFPALTQNRTTNRGHCRPDIESGYRAQR